MLLLALALLQCARAQQLNKDLVKAIKDNNPSMINIALKAGVKGGVNAVIEDGDSPLMLAVRSGKHKAVSS